MGSRRPHGYGPIAPEDRRSDWAGPRSPVTIRLPDDLHRNLKLAVLTYRDKYPVEGPKRLTKRAIVTWAIEAMLESLAEKHGPLPEIDPSREIMLPKGRA